MKPYTATMIDEALRYMEIGWLVFPVDGKVPATRHGVKDAGTEERLAKIWYKEHPDRGVALATGRPSGVWALDLDSQEAVDLLVDLQREHGDLPTTVTSKTKKGYHLLWQMPEVGDVRNSASKVAPGIDVRGTGGYIVLPPSPHPDGGVYRWANGRAPEQVRIASAPDWLLEKVRGGGEERAEPAGPIPDRISEGGRNQTLTSLAGSLRRRGASKEAILAALSTENQYRCDPPLPSIEVEKIATSVSAYEPAEAAPYGGNGVHVEEALDVEPPEIALVDFEVLESIKREKLKPLSVVPTPWPTWNVACRGSGGGEGLAHGWHVVIGAGSGSGKSLMATNLAAEAVRRGEDVCFLSLEMSRAEVVTRLLAIYANETARKLEHGGRFSEDAWVEASEMLQEASGSIRINERPLKGLHDIGSAIRHYADQGCRMMIVDYLQLAWVRGADGMFDQITEVSHTVRGLAQECDILTIGLSQINRKMSFEGGTPVKEGLMGGSSLENDADQVVVLGKPEPDERGNYRNTARLDKNRHGPQAEWAAMLETKTLRIREIDPDEAPAYRLE